MSKNIYVYLDENSNIKGMTSSKEQAKAIKSTGGNVLKLNKDLREKVKDIPEEKEIVELFNVPMTIDEEDDVITELNERLVSMLDTIDSYMLLIPYLKLPDNVRYQLEEFNFYLSNLAESIGNNCDEDYSYILDTTGMVTDILVDIRKRK